MGLCSHPGRPSSLLGFMSPPLRRVLLGAVLFGAICILAVTGYMSAGWRLDDAIYMVVITIFGVGYGEVQPVETQPLRALTIAVIVGGYGAVLYTVGGFMQMLIDGELNRALGARRMTKGIERISGHTIVCGIGRLGSILAKELAAAEMPFVVIDEDLQRLQDAEAQGYLVLQGDATQEHVLEKAGIDRAQTVASVLSQDAVNVFVTITAKSMNPNVQVIARGENPYTEKKLLGCGANQVILPTAIGAKKMAQLIARPTAESILARISDQSTMRDDLQQIGLQFNELTVSPNSELAGKPLSDIEIRGNQGYLVAGIRHDDGTTELNPQPELVLRANDIVVVLSHEADLPALTRRFKQKKPKMTYRGSTIGS